MQEMLHLLAETANELLRAIKSETYHFVLCPDETRHKVRSDVTTSSNDDNAHPRSPGGDMRGLVFDVKHRFHSNLPTLSGGA
jgi:hypothetical protein